MHRLWLRPHENAVVSENIKAPTSGGLQPPNNPIIANTVRFARMFALHAMSLRGVVPAVDGI